MILHIPDGALSSKESCLIPLRKGTFGWAIHKRYLSLPDVDPSVKMFSKYNF